MFHRRGQLAQAEGFYREILTLVPEQGDALHMLGVLEAQRNNHGIAVDLIRRAIELDPDNPAAHNNHGNALRGLSRHQEALASFDRALALKPDYAEAFNNRGNTLRSLGRPEDALASYDRALALKPDNPETLNNRGNVLQDLKRHDDALTSYDQALALKPGGAEAFNSRGVVLLDLNRPEEALASYDRALALKPDYAEALNNRGIALRNLNRFEEALASYDRALALKPHYLDAHLNRGHTLNALKRYQEAIASYQAALACGGDQELVHYHLAALGAETSPSAPPRSYVEGLFDHYATRFDEALLELKYGIPEQLFKTVVAVRPEGERDIADLGCGTGLCGLFFRSIARTLVGVDLSANMLKQAAKRGIYDRLLRAELTDFLGTNAGSFDLVIAADVFIYVGDIDAVFAATWMALRPGGQFAFSVESDDGDGFALRPSRRYAHSLPYLRGLAAKYGFVERQVLPVAVRQAEGQDIPGFIVIFDR